MKTHDSAASTGRGGLHLAMVIGAAVVIGACAIGAMRVIGEREPTPPEEVTQTSEAGRSGRDEGRPSSMLAALNAGPQCATAAPAARSAMPDTTSSKAPSSAAPPTSDRGAVLFARQCALCHGDTGDGGGKFAYLMNPRPRNLQVGDFKLSTTENRIPSDSDLFRTISSGMPGSAMPPWDHLPQSDIEALVAHVRQIHVDATRRMLESWVEEGTIEAEELPRALAERTEPGPALKVPPEPPFDKLRWFRGRRLYLQNCASCHGADGERGILRRRTSLPQPPVLEDHQTHEQTVSDLPKVEPVVTRYVSHSGWCPCCRRRVRAKHPDQPSTARVVVSASMGWILFRGNRVYTNGKRALLVGAQGGNPPRDVEEFRDGGIREGLFYEGDRLIQSVVQWAEVGAVRFDIQRAGFDPCDRVDGVHDVKDADPLGGSA